MRDANEYGDAERKLAGVITPYLTPGGSVCDAGCGLGYLSIELARGGRRVLAVDVCDAALGVLRENLFQKTVRGVSVLNCDVSRLPRDLRFDDMVFCLFCGVRETLKIAREHCDGNVIMAKKAWANHRFTLKEAPLQSDTASEAEQFLNAHAVSYLYKSHMSETGQPLRSLEDGVRFFRQYSKDDDPLAITQSDIEERVIRTGSAQFPYYLPSCRELGIFIVRARDIPDSLQA